VKDPARAARQAEKKRWHQENQAARKRERQRQHRSSLLKRWGIGVAVAAGLITVAFVVVRSTGGGVAVAGDLHPGGQLQSFSLPALQGSGTVTYDSLKDRPLVLNFFASWCPYCVGEMPGFEQVHQQLGSRVGFLGVAQTDTSRQASRDLVHQTGISYVTAVDSEGRLFSAFGGVTMPVTVFIRPGGQIAEIHSGSLDPGTLRSLIVQYFGQQYAAAA